MYLRPERIELHTDPQKHCASDIRKVFMCALPQLSDQFKGLARSLRRDDTKLG